MEGLDEKILDKNVNRNVENGLQMAIISYDLTYKEGPYMNNLFTSGRHKHCSIKEVNQR